MIEEPVANELDARLAELRTGHDVVPFMTGSHAVKAVVWKPLPDEILELLVESGDYQPVIPGEAPTWFEVAGPDGHVSLIIYRAVSDEQFYVVAPDR